MALALAVGTSSDAAKASSGKDAAASAQAETGADRGIAKLEKRVSKAPRNAEARADLAQAYLAAGRFQSAVTTFEDAVSLGEDSAHTGLGMALAYIGAGRQADALSALDRWRDRIPTSDLGLAIALAGQPAQGVELITGALRNGDNTPKSRQNLAYAYALDGRWSEARLVAGQDVSADQLDARLSDWASRARPDQYQARIAALLGAPERIDAGQPAALALNVPAQPADMARAEAVAAAEPVVPVPAKVQAPAPAAELPPVQPAVREEAPARAFQAAFAAEPAVSRPAAVPMPAKVRAVPPAPVSAKAVKQAKAPAAPRQMQPVPAVATRATHYVQLGSFSSMANAKNAMTVFAARNPALKPYSLRITQAQVGGRQFFRVSAEGFDKGSAQAMCSSVRQRGGGCLAFAGARVQTGPALAAARPTTLMARR